MDARALSDSLAHQPSCGSLCCLFLLTFCLFQIFNLVDRDKGGSISKSELAQLMDTLAINASQQEIDLMIGEIDKNNDGEIQVSKHTESTLAATEAEQYAHPRIRLADSLEGCRVC